MNSTILQQYLSLQFIPIDDESGVEKLNKAIEVLVKKLKKEKSRIAQFTLVALDPNISPDDPILQEVQAIVIEKWPVFINKVGGNNLVTYNRAVILQTLSELCSDSIEIAGIVWLTGSSILKHYSFGREEETLKTWLSELGNKYEEEARKMWTVTDFKLNSKLPEFKNSDLQLKYNTVNKVSLKEKLYAAAGPNKLNDSGQQVGTEGNRYWPQNNPVNWVTDFGNLASEGIASSIDAISKGNSNEVVTYLSKSDTKINEFLNQLKPYFEGLGNSLLNKSNSLDLRSQLLWLKESQFSNSLNASYREAESDLLPFFIANDVSEIIPKLYPASVDHFAKEIARVSKSNADSTTSIFDAIEAGSKNALIKNIVASNQESTGRIPLYTFIAGCFSGKHKKEELTQYTGIKNETTIPKTELLVWLLHDMQAFKLSTSK